MNEAVIEVRNLSVSYKVKGGLIRVVDNVSARFERGEVTALIGESGCGKSTLTAAMLGILPMSARISPESQILFNGENILNQEKEAGRLFRWQKASMVFQAAQSAWNPTLRLGEQLMDSIFDHQPGCSVSTAEAKVCELLELVRLDPARILPAYPHQLSGGMRQRAVIAMSLVLDPELIILDEPTTALDTITQSYVFDILQNIHKTRALSMIFITHDMAAAARLSRNMMVMYGGRIMEVNKTSAVFLGAVHPYTRGLIDSTPFIDSEVSAKKPISGAPPDLLNPPSGCLFHPRCPDVKPICREKKPELNNYNQVLSCCHFPGRGNNE